MQAEGSAWRGGWHRAAHKMPSPNFNARPPGTDISLIVVHSISLPPGQFGTRQVHELFTNSLDWDSHPYFAQIRGLHVSAHFFIERDGSLWQFVDCKARAWHAGRSSFKNRENCNDYSVGIELEGLEGGRFESTQYATLSTLCADIASDHPITAVVGHEDIAPGRKHDPGAGFDWSGFQQRLGWPAHQFPFHHQPRHISKEG